MASLIKRAGVETWQAKTQQRIDEQRKLLATLRPNTHHHYLATMVLLTFQDTLAVLNETEAILAEAKKALAKSGR